MALVHSLRPDLFKYNQMDKSNPRANVVQAMNMADQHMGIPPLLDPEHVVSGNADEKSVMTYVVNFMTYESENHTKVTQLQAEYGEEARQADVKRAAQVDKQREALQREQKVSNPLSKFFLFFLKKKKKKIGFGRAAASAGGASSCPRASATGRAGEAAC